MQQRLMRKPVIIVAGVFMAAIWPAWAATATPVPTPVPQYYKADPAKLAQLEAQRCQSLNNEHALIGRRLKSGYNHHYDIVKMQDRLKVVDADLAKYCKPAAPN